MADARLLLIFALTIVTRRFGVIEGQTITHVYVQGNAPVTLTCPADDQATTLTWTGPGGALYVTGTTVETGLDAGFESRISASHTGGSYTLTFTEFRSSDTGIYTCTVDGTVELQMVIVQGVTSASPVYTRQGGTVILQCPDTGGGAQWTVTSTGLVYTLKTTINPAIPDDTRTRLSVTREGGTYNLQIRDVQLSDVREYRCNIGDTGTFYHLLLYVPPGFPEIENTVSVAGQNRTTGTEDGSVTLTCNARGGTPAASVSWKKDGANLVTSDNTVQYTKVFTRADDRTVYTCQSSSLALTSLQTTSVLVYLDLKPGQPTISDQLSQTENTNLQVVCVSTGSRPAAAIEWNVGGTWQSSNPTEVKVLDSATDTYTVTSTLSSPATRQDNGKSVYCRASNRALSGGIESVPRSITVLFGPDGVSITGNRVIVADGTNTLTLTCTTQEYNRHVHITWYNGTTQIFNTAVVTNTSGTNGGSVSTQVLQLTPGRYHDGSVVRCVVQNEDLTLAERAMSVTLDVNYGPYLTLTPTPGVTMIEGGDLEIRCDVDSNPPSSITWSRVGGQLPSNADVTSGVLRILSTHRTDKGTYQCTAQNSVGTGQDSLVIDVQYRPYLTLTPTPGVKVTEGGDLEIRCDVDSNPASSSITWSRVGGQLPSNADVTSGVLRIPSTHRTDKGTYQCTAQNSVGTGQDSLVIDVQYRPYLTLTPTPGVTVIEGGDLEIRCDVDSNPPSSITWSRIGGQLPSNADVTSGVLRIPSTHRTDKGMYRCTAQNSVGTGQSNLTIDIYYPPDIHVSYTNTTYTSPDRVLTCDPDGNPDTYQFDEWRHTSEDGTEIRRLTGSSSPTQSVLTLPDPGVTRRYEDTGYYVCTASNNIPVSSSYMSGSVFFVVEAPPVVITNTTVVKGQIGNNITMEVEFYSRPAVSSIDVTWTRGSAGLSSPDKSVTSIDGRSILMSFHDVNVQVNGYVAVIEVQHLVEQDFGDYTVTIENSLGTINYSIVLKSASPPLPPTDVEQLTHDSTSITVQWTPRFNGGAEQHFVIGYKSDISEDFMDLAPIQDSHELTQSYKITGLKATITHFIRIYSQNELGRSEFVYLNQTTAAAPEEGPSIGPLVGGIAGSALGLIAIAVVAVVVYKRRTTDKHDDMEMINGPKKTSADDDSDGLKSNILYESSNGLKANVLYESAGANFQPQPGTSSEYATVSKPNKKNGVAVDPNSVYAVVDKPGNGKKDNKNDVYAEVVKQPKGKGGKGKKKPPVEQKQTKGGKKDKKKADHSNDGDVYENVNSNGGLEEKVYANDGSSAKNDQRPSRKRNQDGLVYLEVEFKDNDNGSGERRAVIHGIENRNDYADVDFTQRADPLPDEDEPVEKTE